MTSYHVRVLARAERDLDDILRWLTPRSPLGAARWLAAFEQAKDKLVDDPLLFGFAPENEFVDPEIRQIVFKTRHGGRYRVLFTLVGSEVRILHVRAPGQPLLRPKELPSS